MKIQFRLEKLEVGKVTSQKDYSLVDKLMGTVPSLDKEDSEATPELVRATFQRMDTETSGHYGCLDITLDKEVAKLYMVGELYEIEI